MQPKPGENAEGTNLRSSPLPSSRWSHFVHTWHYSKPHSLLAWITQASIDLCSDVQALVASTRGWCCLCMNPHLPGSCTLGRRVGLRAPPAQRTARLGQILSPWMALPAGVLSSSVTQGLIFSVATSRQPGWALRSSLGSSCLAIIGAQLPVGSSLSFF